MSRRSERTWVVEAGAALIGLGALIRLWRVDQRPTSEGSWREVDGFALAHHLREGVGGFLSPAVDWVADGPVATEAPFVPWLAAQLYGLVGESFWVGRALVIASGLLGLWAFWALSRRLVSPQAATVALAVMAVHPLWAYYGRAMMPDTPAWALATLGLLALDGALLRGGLWRWVGCGLLLALAGLCKPPALILGAVAVALIVARKGFEGLLRPWPWAVLAMTLVPLGLWLMHVDALYARSGATFGLIHGHDKLQPSLALTSAWWDAMLPRLMSQTLPAGYLPVVLVGLFGLLRRQPAVQIEAGDDRMPSRLGARVVLVWALVGLGFLFVAAEGNRDMPHYQMALVPPLALIIGLGVEAVAKLEAPFALGRALARVLVAGLCLLGAGSGLLELRASMTPSMARWEDGARIRPRLPEGGLILVLGAHTHHEGGEDYDPRPFFHVGARGWALAEAGYCEAGLASYCALGASAILINHPDPHLDGGELAHEAAPASFKVLLREMKVLESTPSYTLLAMPACAALGPPRARWSARPGSGARPLRGGFVLQGLAGRR